MKNLNDLGVSRSKRNTLDIEIKADDNYIEVSSGVARLSAKGRATGSAVTMLFLKNMLVVNGADSGRKYKSLRLAQSLDFWAKPGDILQVVFNAQSDMWLEVARTIDRDIGYVSAGSGLSG